MKRPIPILLGLLLVLTAWACSRALASQPPQLTTFTHSIVSSIGTQALAQTLPKPERLPKLRRSARHLQDLPVPDGYDGAERWCQAASHPCQTDADCRGSAAVDSAPHRCVTPWWVKASGKNKKDKPTKVCGSPWPTRAERNWREARLAQIVEEICSGAECDAGDLTAFLSIVATRESTMRPWKAHRLDGDVRANASAWLQRSKRYGHEPVIIKTKRSGKTFEEIVAIKFSKDGNRYYSQEDRWQGLGYYGQNSALFVALWDSKAPPEILCHEIESTDTYLKSARSIVRKQADLGIEPTYATVHYALGTGDLRPKPSSIEKFIAKAKRHGLNAAKRVTTRSFGRELGPTVESRRLAAEILRGKVEAKHPWPGRAAGS